MSQLKDYLHYKNSEIVDWLFRTLHSKETTSSSRYYSFTFNGEPDEIQVNEYKWDTGPREWHIA